MWRACGLCGAKDIPFGVDWPWWTDGQPVHEDCQKYIILEGKLMEHEHLYHQTPISDNAKVEFAPLSVTRQLERSAKELAASNYELQNQNILMKQAFRNFVLSTEKFLSSDGDHTGWHRKDLAHCPICQQFDLALATAKFIVQP